jgi:hypothetical protein
MLPGLSGQLMPNMALRATGAFIPVSEPLTFDLTHAAVRFRRVAARQNQATSKSQSGSDIGDYAARCNSIRTAEFHS